MPSFLLEFSLGSSLSAFPPLMSQDKEISQASISLLTLATLKEVNGYFLIYALLADELGSFLMLHMLAIFLERHCLNDVPWLTK